MTGSGAAFFSSSFATCTLLSGTALATTTPPGNGTNLASQELSSVIVAFDPRMHTSSYVMFFTTPPRAELG